MTKYQFIFLVIISLAGSVLLSCKHNPVLGDDNSDPNPNPVDTTMNPVDTTGNTNPCLPDVVYFEKDVLPILRSNCAFSGCHNSVSAADGVKLDSYENVVKTGKLEINNPVKSEMYKVLIEPKDKDRMPPPPAPRLSQDQINIILKWIQQGAKNLTCNESGSVCNTVNISYKDFIKPLLTNSCVGCHNVSNPGGGIKLDSYSDVKSAAQSGKLYGAVNHSPGFKPMPQGGNKMSVCNIAKIKSWIEAGTLNN